MENKTVLITGGSSGIGLHTAIGLARSGAAVVLAVRDLEKGTAAAREIREKAGDKAMVEVLGLELSDLRSIQGAAREFYARWPKLDVLINNAGLFTTSYTQTAQGFELQFGVNHLGHFLLTHLLAPALRKSPEPRVVNVSSLAYLQGRLDPGRLREWPGNYNGLAAYTQSKLCNVLFTLEWAKRFPEIPVNALHPGVIGTRFGAKHSRFLERALWLLYRPFMVGPEEGARTSIYLASAPEVQGISGGFFDEKQRRRSIAAKALQNEGAQILWEKSEAWTREFF
jgi:NAD(P)-dependent dehydrogenase (short-subunit alcohol dehydrogenase family)